MEVNTEQFYQVIYFGISTLTVFVVLIVLFFINHRLRNREATPSPYTGLPLRRGEDLSYDSKLAVLRYLYSYHQYDNHIFEVTRSAYCRETGRIFPNAVTFWGTIDVDWEFLQKRFPGQWISWGSLNSLQQEAIIDSHHTIEGFQMDNSSSIPSPRGITKDYCYTKPGPLYVDLNTKILLGWKQVPNTTLEVLIVQKPKGIFEIKR